MTSGYKYEYEHVTKPNRCGVTLIKRCIRDGTLNCGPRGAPAVEEYNAEGQIVRVWRYASGKLANGPNGEPAIQEYEPSGRPVYTAYADIYAHGNDPI